MHFFWTIFFLDYVLPAFQSPVYFLFASLVMASMVLRMVAWRKKKHSVVYS